MLPEKINVRGVLFDDVTLKEATDILGERLDRDTNNGVAAVYTPNSEIVQLCIDQNEYYELINSAEMVVPDGIGVIKAAKILGTPMRERVPGVELGEKMIEYAANNGHNVFFLGGKPGVAEKAAEKMTEKYPALSVGGCADGYFTKEGEESDEVIGKIADSGAELLFVCLGVPVQEKWIRDNKEKLSFIGVKVALALGGSLDVYSGNVKRAPALFRKTGFEWLYRLLCQPSRIGRMMKLPKFLIGTYREKKNTKK
ncbi:MAG: WecB/TagA/CpsF family glycosyltransferase [Ruminococcaceae bacterium]|nr:WecB/TagA/CpsF family glycosyltransferase [Oscillospiraceae bacterium]